MAKHAKLSPSAAHRWIHCPGSVALSEQCPPPGTSEYAEEGTAAHALGEAKLRERAGLEADLQACRESPYYCGEMDEATDFYADTVTECFYAAGDGPEMLMEQRFNLDHIIPGCFGTSDAVIIGDRTLQVIDLKYGKGIKVEAEGNPQLRLYALGCAELFSGLYDFDEVVTTIVQPRLDHVSAETMTVSELYKWAEDVVKPAARAAAEGTGELHSGDWCRWCPAKAICRTRAEENLELTKYEFAKPPLLSLEEIGEVLKQAEELQKWAADVADYALQQACAGEEITGWKVVEGRSVRKYADDLKVAEALMAAGYDEAMLYERKLCGITAMEKLVGKKKLAETLGELIIKPAGKPTLVPASDKREAMNTAKEDFKEE